MSAPIRTAAYDTAAYLAAQSSLSLTLGTNLFVAHLPLPPPAAVAVFDVPGGGREGSQTPARAVDRVGVQVVARATTYEAAATKIRAVERVLVNMPARAVTQASGVRAGYDCARPSAAPLPLGQDEQGRYQFSQTFMVYQNDPDA